jgi:hypothetical protein
VKDAVLADNERRINSIDEAITVDAKKYPALKFYSKGDALMSAASCIMSFRDAPTWIRLGKAKFKKLSVTASLPGTGLSATTTAEPVSLHIEPGTADARGTRPPANARSTRTAASAHRTRRARPTRSDGAGDSVGEPLIRNIRRICTPFTVRS